MPKIDRPELFLIPAETIAALSQEEVDATYLDMEGLGVARLPYPKVDIGISASDYFLKYMTQNRFYQQKLKDLYGGTIPTDRFTFEMRIRLEDEQVNDVIISVPGGRHFSAFDEAHRSDPADPTYAHALLRLGYNMKRALVVLLATKNAVKTRRENKALRLGIGTKNAWKPLYTTTITLPARDRISESTGAPGVSKRPHLRRGHTRNQRYGPKLAFTRKVWIEPAFINADEQFISARTAYNTSLTN